MSQPRTRPAAVRAASGLLLAVVFGLGGGVIVPAPASAQIAATTPAASEVTTQAIVQFHRLAKTVRDHFHTTDWNEVVTATSRDGYRYEGVDGVVFSVQEAGTVPFYRVRHRNSPDHFHTTSWAEVVRVTSWDNYVYEGIGAYVYPADSTMGVPFYRLRHGTTTDHFHTTSWAEVVDSTTNYGYIYEGIGARVGI
ncbi:hypothetical protein IOD16_09790 [Saccharothrix sp. 6-C]|uniref:hypothetical protein n=1 Tax=Saccharothrix sp. 6-C TaxID=2781735 RepID=UPI00191778C8|nr:hypothetical protein [Saccharothrix sp. 6-C]QQQ78706.1 hypothetical protein IOD16_09790 [Saccharothrix sp. 6-C]